MKDVRQYAAGYLNIKPRTEEQLTKYLKSKGFDEMEISEAVSELKEYHYIDDLSYSIEYFNYGFEKCRGIARIKRELADKGVEQDIIEEAYRQLEHVPDQYETAMLIANNIAGGSLLPEMSHDEKMKLQARIGRRLASRGFSSDVVYRVLNDLR